MNFDEKIDPIEIRERKRLIESLRIEERIYCDQCSFFSMNMGCQLYKKLEVNELNYKGEIIQKFYFPSDILQQRRVTKSFNREFEDCFLNQNFNCKYFEKRT